MCGQVTLLVTVTVTQLQKFWKLETTENLVASKEFEKIFSDFSIDFQQQRIFWKYELLEAPRRKLSSSYHTSLWIAHRLTCSFNSNIYSIRRKSLSQSQKIKQMKRSNLQIFVNRWKFRSFYTWTILRADLLRTGNAKRPLTTHRLCNEIYIHFSRYIFTLYYLFKNIYFAAQNVKNYIYNIIIITHVTNYYIIKL